MKNYTEFLFHYLDFCIGNQDFIKKKTIYVGVKREKVTLIFYLFRWYLY